MSAPTTDLVAWLLEQIDEDQRVALAAEDAAALARCDAHARIVDLHTPANADEPYPDEKEYVGIGCPVCHYDIQIDPMERGYCDTMKLLASGYRHRAGYLEQWRPQP